MDHWHSALCHSPVVELGEDFLPRCLACGCSFSLSDLLSRQGPSSYLPIPPDKALGELNLSWPSTVRYSLDQSRRKPWGDPVQPHHGDGSGHEDEPGAINTDRSSGDLDTARQMLLQTSVKDQHTVPQPYIYERRLSKDEIRLICLPATTDDAATIHISLEVHQHDRCPEYETLSYTWGGEDNDSGRIHPIYIGPHWHALLQTKNCWDMLRFLRPSRGVRLVWIDAICINQLDDEERAIQVGKMARIYEDCQRVVVFLGRDVVRKEPGRYPRRRKLGDALRPDSETGELTNAEDIDIASILRKRYFKRVWIIQELILAPRVVIQIDDVQLWVDPRASLYPGRWDLTPVPWFIYLTQKQLEESSIYDLLRTTWKNEATDIRDKIFGVHALLRDPECSKALQPDYTLSCLEAYIGVFAHLLIHEKRIEVLYNAAGSSMAPARPTWLPDWTVSDATKVFRPVPSNEFDERRASGPGEWARSAAYRLLRKFEDLSEDEHREYLYSIDRGQDRPDERERYETANGQPKPRDPQRNIVHIINEPGTISVQFGAVWDSTAFVDPRTGALTIDLVYILQFRTMPRAWGVWRDSQLFRLNANNGKVAMYLTVQDLELDKMIIPGRDHLFVLWCGNKQPYIYLILRECTRQNYYTLVGVCSYLCFEVGKYRSCEIDIDDVDNVDSDIDDMDDYDSDTNDVDNVDTEIYLPDLLLSPESLPSYVRNLLYCAVKEPYEIDKLNRLFPATNSANRIAVLQTLASETWSGDDNHGRFSHGRFTEAYIASIPPRFRPRAYVAGIPTQPGSKHPIRRKYGHRIEIILHPAVWESMRGECKDSGMDLFDVCETQYETSLGAWVDDLVKLARDTDSYGILHELQDYVQRKKTELEVGMQPEYGYRPIADPQWSRDIAKGFEIDGTTYSVTII